MWIDELRRSFIFSFDSGVYMLRVGRVQLASIFLDAEKTWEKL